MRRDGPDIMVFPPAVSVAAPVLALVLQVVAPISLLPPILTWWSLIAGAALLGVAFWLAAAGAKAFRAAGTNVDPRDAALVLVEGGPYRFTRNPMYLGMVVLQLGLALTFSLDWALLGAPLVWALLHFGVVLREEAYLSEAFGEAYLAYLKARRRWV